MFRSRPWLSPPLRVAPGPHCPVAHSACGECFAPGAQKIGLSRKRAKGKGPLGPGGLAAPRSLCPARRSTLRPGTPRRSTSLNKRTRVKATPGFAALAFFASRSVSRSAARSLVLSPLSWAGSPPPGPSYRRSLSRGFAGLRPSGFLAPFGGRGSPWSLSLPALAVRLCRPAAFGRCPSFRWPHNFLGGKYHNEFAESKAKSPKQTLR